LGPRIDPRARGAPSGAEDWFGGPRSAPWPSRALAADQLGECWDAVVIGAGPAGSIASVHLASRGHRTLLLDREVFPREKVCGDGLIPDALRALGRAGLEGEIRRRGHSLRLASIFSPSRIEVEVPGDFVTLERRTLDAMLVQGAVASGAVFRTANVESVQVEDGGSVACRVTGLSEPLRARAALVTTGARVGLLRRHGLVQRERASGIALRCYVRSRHELDRLVISYDRSILPGYAWIFPLGEGVYNVGCGVFDRADAHTRLNLRETFRSFCDRFPLARRLLQSGQILSPLKGAPLRCGLEGVTPVSRGALLAAGETIGATFPFSGEGIGKAMETAELAAGLLHQALDSGDFRVLSSFGERLRAELADKYVGYRVAERWVSRAWIVDFMARRARRSPFLRDAMAGIIADTADPRPFFSLRGLLRSYLN
jgi:geranylgeranyl reductase family protein